MQIDGIGQSDASRAARRQVMFTNADTNGDGSLNLGEFSALLATRTAPPAANGSTPPSAADLFAKFDTDGNGQLSQTELDAGMKSIRQSFKAHHHHHPDNDGDGDDATNANGINPSAINPADLFAKIDTNGDGNISLDELTTAITPPSGASTDSSTSTNSAASQGSSDIANQRQLHFLLEAFASQFNVSQQLQAA